MSRLRVIVGACALAVVVVLVLVLSGGGGGGGELVSGSALAQAARNTERVPGASVAGSGTTQVEGLSSPIHMRMQGVQNSRQSASDVVVHEQVPGKNGLVDVEVITLLPHMYMRSPLFKKIPHGKQWVGMNLVQAAKSLGVGDLTQFRADPSQSLQSLRAVSPRVEKLGSEDVRGVPTTHYRANVELRRLPAVVPPARRAEARRSTARLIQLMGTDSYPTEVWVDKRHLVRRLRLGMKMKLAGHSASVDMTTDYFDFGPKQKIKPPPAGDVYDATKLASRASAGGP